MVTIDTNIAVYALSLDARANRAGAVLRSCAFISVQVLNEYANVGLRKRRDPWPEIVEDLNDLRAAVPRILPIGVTAHDEAVRLAARYQLNVYDALMLAVALEGGARTIYSEDMHHDLLVDGTLRIVDPFR